MHLILKKSEDKSNNFRNGMGHIKVIEEICLKKIFLTLSGVWKMFRLGWKRSLSNNSSVENFQAERIWAEPSPKPPQNFPTTNVFLGKWLEKGTFWWEYLGLAQVQVLWPSPSIKYWILEKMGGGGSFKTAGRKFWWDNYLWDAALWGSWNKGQARPILG